MYDLAATITVDPENALLYSHSQILELLKTLKSFLKERNEFPLIRIPKNLPKKTVVFFAGDTHGDYQSSFYSGKHLIVPSQYNADRPSIVIFLGDYIDRPPKHLEFGSIINILYLLSLKYLYPTRIYLLRGNHEAHGLMPFSPHEFPNELKEHFGERYGEKIHSAFIELFSYFPIFAQLDNGIFAAHGGFPKRARNLSTILLSDREQILHTLWGDPAEANKYRGAISDEANFTKDELKMFLAGIGAKIMIRGHDYSSMGYPMYENKLLTVFTSEKYKTRGSKGILLVKTDPRKPVTLVLDLELVEIYKKKFKKRNLRGY